MSAASLSVSIELPPDYRMNDFLAFHRRDPMMAAERVDARTLHKGLTWKGSAACLTITFHSGHADAALAIDGPADKNPDVLENMVLRMLGLTQPVETFEFAYRAHPHLGHLIARQPGLRVPLSPTPFEALAWAVTGQQISLAAAISLRRGLILSSGVKHSRGLACFPDADRVAAMSEEALRAAGFSRTKATTLVALSRLVQQGLLPLDAWMENPPVDVMREQLLLVRGIGPWTVDYALLRGYGWLDGSLHGDVAVRRGLQVLVGGEEKISEVNAQKWLTPFSPWRGLVAAHLWAMLSPGVHQPEQQ